MQLYNRINAALRRGHEVTIKITEDSCWVNNDKSEPWIALIPLWPPGIIVNMNITVVKISTQSKMKDNIYPFSKIKEILQTAVELIENNKENFLT